MSAAKHYQAIAEEAILDHFRNPEHEPFHSDDLWHIIPDQHRGVISLAVMALVNKRLMVGCGYRKSAIPSRKRSPSQEYRLTELGRDRIAGVGAGSPSGKGDGFPSRPGTADMRVASPDPGDQSRPSTGAPTSKESGSDTNPAVPSASDRKGESPAVPHLAAAGDSARQLQGGRDRQVRSAGSAESDEHATAAQVQKPDRSSRGNSTAATQPARLFELPVERPGHDREAA